MKKLLFVVGGVIAVWLVAAAFMPKHFEYEKGIAINAPKEVVFNQVDVLKNWPNWDPNSKIDTALEIAYAQNSEGRDTSFSWLSRYGTVGNGSLTLTESNPPSLVRATMVIENRGHSDTWFKFEDGEGGGTTATWGMSFDVSWPFNAFMVFSKGSKERTMNQLFEGGLADLKAAAEKAGSGQPASASVQVKAFEYPGATYLGVRKKIGFSGLSPQFFADGYAQISTLMGKAKLQAAGRPAGVYFTWEEATKTTDMAVVIPIPKGNAVNGGNIQTIDLPPGKALFVDHIGGYSSMGKAHTAITEYIKAQKFVEQPPVIEEYVTDANSEPDSNKWVTRVIYFIK